MLTLDFLRAAFDDVVTRTGRAADRDARHGPCLPRRSYEDEAQGDMHLTPAPLLKHYPRIGPQRMRTTTRETNENRRQSTAPQRVRLKLLCVLHLQKRNHSYCTASVRCTRAARRAGCRLASTVASTRSTTAALAKGTGIVICSVQPNTWRLMTKIRITARHTPASTPPHAPTRPMSPPSTRIMRRTC